MIEPLVIQFLLAVLLQRVDLLLHRCFLRFQDQITQQILHGILIPDQVAVFPVIRFRLLDISLAKCQICQFCEQTAADRRALIGNQKDVLRVLVFQVLLIDAGRHRQKAGAAHPPPVDGVGDLHRSLIIALVDQLFDLLDFDLELVLIHFTVSSYNTHCSIVTIPCALPERAEALPHLYIPDRPPRGRRWQFLSPGFRWV